MESGIIVILVIAAVLLYLENRELQKQVKAQQAQLDRLCEATGNQPLSSCYISNAEKAEIAGLKSSGKTVEAVKKARELTAMDLVQAKQYVDGL